MNIEKLNAKEQLAMYQEIDKNYKSLKLPEIEPKYNDNGEITNEKEIKEQFKKILLLITTLWLVNKTIIETRSTNLMNDTFSFYGVLKGLKIGKTMVSTKEWKSIISKIVEQRTKDIKINQVIKGNIRVLNKRVQNIVKDMYMQGKTKPQIAKELERTMKYNKGKAKSIATTEINYYKSEAQLQATKDLKIKKTWVYNYKALEPRESHKSANGQVVMGRDGYFNIGGVNTQAPQHFGIASEDINCHCTMRIEVIE